MVKGNSSAALLDAYQAERHPVAARVLQNTMAQTALARRAGAPDTRKAWALAVFEWIEAC